jgi:putative RNA 2'-phosphotransferase
VNQKQRDALSKFLSYVLRHAPESIDLSLDRDGWADVDALIHGAGQIGRAHV